MLDNILGLRESRDDEDLAAAWEELRSLYRAAGLSFVAIFPGTAAAAALGTWLLDSAVPVVVVWLALVVLFTALSNRVLQWPCPRCGEPFFRTWWYHNPFARKCAHCGLRKSASRP
jgi:hypothetical protein